MATLGQIKAGMLHGIYPALYGTGVDASQADKRFLALIEMHEKRFGAQEATLFSTSGRTELGGNHTDHNLGLVLAASINLDTIAAVSKRDDKRIVLDSMGFPLVEINLDDLAKKDGEKGTTASLVRGIASRFQELGYSLTGWQASVASNVLQGSGLSSSAAIEVLVATIINHLDAEDTLDPVSLAQISQYAENSYFGKPSGLLDQVSCAHGGIVAIDFENPKRPMVEPVLVDFKEHGYDLVITDTRADHSGLTDCYASIPKEMKQVAACFGKSVLREVDPGLFMESLPQIRSKVDNDRALLRAIHFFQENGRVLQMIHALKEKDMESYLSLVNQSGESSFCFLQNAYPPSDAAHQAIPLAIALSKEFLGGEGAVRLHGGGFAGTIQAYVPQQMTEAYIDAMENVFGKGCSTLIAVRSLKTSAIG
jgi:galactokinase